MAGIQYLTMIQDLFFRLLKSALWNVPLQLDSYPKADEWYDIYGMARRQTVEGILYDVICDLPLEAGVPRDLAIRWMINARHISERNSRMVALVKQQKNDWRENDVDAVLMKGLSVAAMYPVPEHRITGDIDWLIRGEGSWNRAMELLRKSGTEVDHDSDGDVYYVDKGIVVEYHHKGLLSNTPVGVLVMLNGHVLHHGMVTGIGVRHLCDMAMAYKYYKGSYDMQEYVSCLKDLGVFRWTCLLNKVLVETLGMPADLISEFPASRRISDGDCRRLMRLVMEDGNFGFNKKWRFAGFWFRFSLLFRYVPGNFIKRWFGLLSGRITLKLHKR